MPGTDGRAYHIVMDSSPDCRTMAKWRKVSGHDARRGSLHGFGGSLLICLIVSVSGLLIVAGAFGTFNSAAALSSYATYQNARFGFTIQYPSSFRWSESDNGDGVWFQTPAQGADFRASAGFNALDRTGPELFNAAVGEMSEHDGVVSYAIRHSGGFVVSGVVGSRVRYRRVLFTDDQGRTLDSANPVPTLTTTFWAEYPTSRKGELDPIVSVMSRSLRAGTRID